MAGGLCPFSPIGCVDYLHATSTSAARKVVYTRLSRIVYTHLVLLGMQVRAMEGMSG